MGFLSDIFSVDSANKVVDAVINTGDALVFTNEEKAKFKIELLKNYKPFKVAQRVLSFIFAINFILSFWVGVAIYLIDKTKLNGYIELVATFQLGWIMLAIVSFYFTGGVVDSFKGLKK